MTIDENKTLSPIQPNYSEKESQNWLLRPHTQPKIKKRRKRHRKRPVRIIHTMCFAVKKQNGEFETIYKQKMIKSRTLRHEDLIQEAKTLAETHQKELLNPQNQNEKLYNFQKCENQRTQMAPSPFIQQNSVFYEQPYLYQSFPMVYYYQNYWY